MGLGTRSTEEQLLERCSSPLGLQQTLAFFGIEELAEKLESVAVTQKIQPSYALFDYQRKLCDEASLKLEAADHTVLLHLPTGGGKTRSAMHIVCRHLLRYAPSTVVWLAQSKELLEQAADEFERAWGALGDRQLDLVRFWGASTSIQQ